MKLGKFRLVSYRQRWGLTWQGWLCAAAIAIGAGVTLIRTAHPFLAVSQPLDGGFVVVEGWMPEYAINQVAAELKTGRYPQAYTIGGPVSGVQNPAPDDDTYAYVAAKRLARAGADPKTVHMVPASTVTRDRTFHAASTLRSYLARSGVVSGRFNIITLGPHARRTRLLFEKAFGDNFEIGIIALKNEEYDPVQWWRYSEGIKEIISEFSGYLYARFMFDPTDE